MATTSGIAASTPLLPLTARVALSALGAACLALGILPVRDYPSLHIILDTSISLLALILTALLGELGARTSSTFPVWLAIVFGVVTVLALMHVGVSIDWFGRLEWIASNASMLRPTTWPPSVHLLPIAVLVAMTPWCRPGGATLAFAVGTIVLAILLILLFDRLPRYTAPTLFGITRPNLALVPLLWMSVAWVAWRRRTAHPLHLPLAAMGVMLATANLVMLYSRAPHDSTAMITHLGRMAGFMTLMFCIMDLATQDSLHLAQAERALGGLNRDLERRVEERTLQLEQSHERFRGVVEHASSGMVMVDRNGIIALVNREAERLFGYHRAELLGKPVELLVPTRMQDTHMSDRRRFQEIAVARAMGKGRDLYGVRKDGIEVPIEIGLNPIETAEGPFVLASVVDITQRKMAEQELRRSNEELERFAYVASHDLQEPLRMVASYVQLLGKRYQGRLDQDADDFIGFAVDGAMRMQRLIEDLLTFSRVGSRGAPILPTELDGVMRQACHDLAVTIRESGARIVHDHLPVVMGDARQLGQLLTNLLSNAIKFRTAAAPLIHIEAQRHGAWWEITVRDNGIGIEAQYFERIFVLFQRLHTREEYSGTGIGLAIARKIVERHGGKLWVESAPGKGSVFHLTLLATESDR